MPNHHCACPSAEADQCIRERYHLDVEATVDEPCTCVCHEQWDAFLSDEEADE